MQGGRQGGGPCPQGALPRPWAVFSHPFRVKTANIHRQSVNMTTEMVLARMPEVIIEMAYTAESINKADLDAWNRLSAVPAVKNRRVVLLIGEEFSNPWQS